MSGQFEACAIFAGEENSVEAYRLQFSKELQNTIEKTLSEQLKAFEQLSPVDFNGRYKADPNECLMIEDYKDPGDVVSSCLSYVRGQSSEIIDSVEDLQCCRALVFHLPSHPNKFLIQRFSRSLIASKANYFSFASGSTFTKIQESSVSLASSLTAVHEIDSKKFYFKNIQTIRTAIPGFVERYAPGADENMISNFFSHSIFDQECAKGLMQKDSKTIARLVWLLHESEVKIENKLEDLKEVANLLNIDCFKDNLITIPTEVSRARIVLNVFLGDVFIQDGSVYLTNSKRALKPFD